MLVRTRRGRLALSRAAKTIAILSVLWTIYDVLRVRHHLARSSAVEPPQFRNEKIFIASIHWTDEAVLRSHWAPAVAQLARDIGPANVFVSIHESGSFDDTKSVLQILDADLELSGVRRRIVLDDATHKDEVEKSRAESGWLRMPGEKSYRENWTEWFTLEKGTWVLLLPIAFVFVMLHADWWLQVPRRIPYLAGIRNQAMQPLYELQQSGEVFDKVLWLNDVVFTTDDVRKLLGTRGGDYAAACALDFKKPPLTYDTFALRDSEGSPALMETWPFFRSSESRRAVKHGQPVPVASCWNGMVVFDAAPFYHSERPLAFRGIADDLAEAHLEGSECCLVHADNALSSSKGVWVNPHVRVGYNGTAYEAVNPANGASWLSSLDIATGLWRNRMGRWLRALHMTDTTVQQRLQTWQSQALDRRELGAFCLIDEMQIMLWNGWGHA
ncbi:hypothetical protein LTR08_007685 [Meristemomyces frigidus]|nr:hypothetical protein LTR08_007685 [Meristemomyces frigidus]